MAVVRTTCNFCYAWCGLLVEEENGRITRVRGDPEHPATRGFVCPKGRAIPEIVHSKSRATHPMIRRNGKLARASWSEALDYAASAIKRLIEESGPTAIAGYLGAPVCREAGEAFRQLLAALGSPYSSEPGDICFWPHTLGYLYTYGFKPAPDLPNTRFLVVWGSGITDISMRAGEGVVYGIAPTSLASYLRRRGAGFAVVDPRETALARQADLWVPVRPGADAALALAMINYVIEHGIYDKSFVEEYTVGFEKLRRHVSKYTPEWAERVAWTPRSKIEKLAEAYASRRPVATRLGNGTEPHRGAFNTARAVAILSAITGNVCVKGGDAYYPAPKLRRAPSVPGFQGFGTPEYPLLNFVPFEVLVDKILGGASDAPRALIVYHGNPVLAMPGEERVRRALEKLDFVLVYDFELNETAEYAHVFLPDASDMERWGVSAVGSPEGGYLLLRRPVIKPVGESKPVMDFEYELAEKLGLSHLYPWRSHREWVEWKIGASGVSLEDFGEKSFLKVSPPPSYGAFRRGGFPTPSGKIELYSERLEKLGLDPLPVHREPGESPYSTPELYGRYPLVCTTRKRLVYGNTRLRNISSLRSLQKQPEVLVSEKDAEARGLKDGDCVYVETARGSILAYARVGGVMSGVAVVDFGWGGLSNVNRIAPSKPRDPASASPPANEFLCEVKACTG